MCVCVCVWVQHTSTHQTFSYILFHSHTYTRCLSAHSRYLQCRKLLHTTLHVHSTYKTILDVYLKSPYTISVTWEKGMYLSSSTELLMKLYLMAMRLLSVRTISFSLSRSQWSILQGGKANRWYNKIHTLYSDNNILAVNEILSVKVVHATCDYCYTSV